MKSNPCTGECCSKFWLPQPPAYYQAWYEKWINQGQHQEDDPDSIRLIGPMLIYIGPVEDGDKKGYWYTCKHYDTETTMCRIYKQRPRMCADYPYDSACTYCGWVNEDFKTKEVLPEGGISGSPI